MFNTQRPTVISLSRYDRHNLHAIQIIFKRKTEDKRQNVKKSMNIFTEI